MTHFFWLILLLSFLLGGLEAYLIFCGMKRAGELREQVAQDVELYLEHLLSKFPEGEHAEANRRLTRLLYAEVVDVVRGKRWPSYREDRAAYLRSVGGGQK